MKRRTRRTIAWIILAPLVVLLSPVLIPVGIILLFAWALEEVLPS